MGMAAYARRSGFRRLGDPGHLAKDLRPAFAAGSALLVLGVLLVVAGGLLFQGQSASLSLWIVLVALFLLLSTMAWNVGRSPAAPVVRDPSPTGTARYAIPARHVDPRPEEAPAPVRAPFATPASAAVARAASITRPSRRLSGQSASDLGTSIPGAYLNAIEHPRPDPATWDEIAPPLAATLPFSAGFGRSLDVADESSATVPEPVLALELARLRARVRELEARRPPALSGGLRALPTPRPSASVAPEPPSPPMLAVVPVGRGCIGCGSVLGAHAAPLLCWGCGRSVCSGCYWRFGPGPGLHRCPECLSRSPTNSTSISGGRSAPPATVGTPAVGTGRSASPAAAR